MTSENEEVYKEKVRDFLQKNKDADFETIQKETGVPDEYKGAVKNLQSVLRLGVLTEEQMKSLPKIQKNWLVEGYLHEKNICIFGGEPSGYKSLTALHLALALAEGAPFLNKYPSKKSRVLYIDEENGHEELLKRLPLLRAGMGLEKSNCQNLVFIPKIGFSIEDQTMRGDLYNVIKSRKIEVIIIDTLSRVRRGDDDKAQEVNKLYTTVFTPLTNQFGVAWVLIHHFRKKQKGGSGEHGIDSDDLRGSSELRNISDSILLFLRKKNADNFVLKHDKMRGSKEQFDQDVHVAWLDGVHIKFEVLGVSASIPPKSKTFEKCADTLIQYCKEKGSKEFQFGELKNAMKDEGYLKTAIREAVDYLIKSGTLVKKSHGVYTLREW